MSDNWKAKLVKQYIGIKDPGEEFFLQVSEPWHFSNNINREYFFEDPVQAAIGILDYREREIKSHGRMQREILDIIKASETEEEAHDKIAELYREEYDKDEYYDFDDLEDDSDEAEEAER